MKIWVTQYALTEGVRVREGTVSCDGKMATVKWPGGLNGVLYLHGKDFQLSEEAAKKRFADMIAAKRKSLAKQIKKLDALEAVGMPMWKEES